MQSVPPLMSLSGDVALWVTQAYNTQNESKWIQHNQRYCLFYPMSSSSSSKPDAYITHNATTLKCIKTKQPLDIYRNMILRFLISFKLLFKTFLLLYFIVYSYWHDYTFIYLFIYFYFDLTENDKNMRLFHGHSSVPRIECWHFIFFFLQNHITFFMTHESYISIFTLTRVILHSHYICIRCLACTEIEGMIPEFNVGEKAAKPETAVQEFQIW